MMLEAVNTSKTLVSFYQSKWCNVPEDSNFLTWIRFVCSCSAHKLEEKLEPQQWRIGEGMSVYRYLKLQLTLHKVTNIPAGNWSLFVQPIVSVITLTDLPQLLTDYAVCHDFMTILQNFFLDIIPIQNIIWTCVRFSTVMELWIEIDDELNDTKHIVLPVWWRIPHFCLHMMKCLNEQTPDWWIGRGGPQNFSLQSQDSTPPRLPCMWLHKKVWCMSAK
jgi:hypothetical protein